MGEKIVVYISCRTYSCTDNFSKRSRFKPIANYI